MSRRSRTSPAPSPVRSWHGRHRVLLILLIVSIIALLFRARGMLAGSARHVAKDHMHAGAVTQAQQWLAWSVWFDPSDGTTDLMRAACFRHLTQAQRWSEAIQSAQRKGAPDQQIQREIDQSSIRAGRLREESEQQQLRALMEAGGSPNEIVAAFVYGYLRREEPKRAKVWLDAFAAEHPNEAQVAYLRGIYRRSQGARARAQTEFKKVLAKHPGHELARAALAELAEEQDLLREALEHYVHMATHSPACEVAQVGMARVLRKLGRIDRAQVVLAPLASSPSPSSDVMIQMGHIELELGHYAAAKRWFEQVDATEARNAEAMSAALMPFADAGSTLLARRLFAATEAADRRFKRADSLKARLALDADDTAAARELARLSSPSAATSSNLGGSGTDRGKPNRPESTASTASDLYAFYCSACHGENGGGNGRAGRHLSPRPRNLRTRAAFRLVSTVNGVPTLEDIAAVIRRGMPGTSMPSFQFLTEHQQRLLAQEVLRLNRDGLREQIIHELSSDEDHIDSDQFDKDQFDKDEVRQLVDQWGTPGEVVRAPPIGPADAQAVSRGKETYFQLGCHNCHGNEGVGAPDMALFDALGAPTRPRDLVHEPLKGGAEPESIYLRIRVGMPGTDHPACPTLPDAQIIDLVHYCRSLSREPKRVLTNHERSVHRTSRAYVSAFGGTDTP